MTSPQTRYIANALTDAEDALLCVMRDVHWIDAMRATMGFHCDSYEGLVPSSLIAIASLGATRTLVFRSTDRARLVAVPLEHGSILLMNETTQREWQHAVKREPDAGLRVSLTFRQICSAEGARLTRA